MCKCNPNIKTPYCGKLGCEWPKHEYSPQKALFERWRSLGFDVANLGNIIQNDRSMPFTASEIENFNEISVITEKAFHRLIDDTLEFIEGYALDERDNKRESNIEDENTELREENRRLKNAAYCAKHGHKWVNLSMIAKYCAPDGSNHYTCERCGEKKSE